MDLADCTGELVVSQRDVQRAREIRMAIRTRKEGQDGVVHDALARATVGVFTVSADGTIAMWNAAAMSIMGFSAQEAAGELSCRLFVGADGGDRLCYRGCHGMAPVRIAKTVHNFDVHTRTKAGRPVWLNVHALGVPGVNGRDWLKVHLFRDVTRIKSLVRLLEERLLGPSSPGAADSLTRREREILELLTSGFNTRAVAERLRVSPATVRNHVQKILDKLGVHSRLEAVAYARSNRLI
jgi:PAS domain S-box-containing protein